MKLLRRYIIEEPNGGAHRDFESSAELLKKALFSHLDALSLIKKEDFLEKRILRYDKLCFFDELSWESTIVI